MLLDVRRHSSRGSDRRMHPQQAGVSAVPIAYKGGGMQAIAVVRELNSVHNKQTWNIRVRCYYSLNPGTLFLWLTELVLR